MILQVYCDQVTDGGGWIVFQRREDGSVDFFRGWADYKAGFGDIEGEFWLGNNNLNYLTTDCCHELRIELEDFDGDKRSVKYSNFSVGPKVGNFVLMVAGCTTGSWDALSGYQNGKQFSTKDYENNDWKRTERHRSGWWHSSSGLASNLNGIYYPDGSNNSNSKFTDGIIWFHWKGTNPLKFTEMKLRETDL